MKQTLRFLPAVALLATLGCGGADEPRPVVDLMPWVDPLIGSRGAGNVFVGAAVPHGMVKLGPDSAVGSGDIDSYDWSNGRIQGFSHTHLEGPGGNGNGYSQVLLTAYTGEPIAATDAWSSAFDHETEVAAPGYYAVTLADWGVRAELTASRLAGVHRYTFPATDRAHAVLDLAHCRGQALDGRIDVVGGDTLEGFGVYQMHPLVAGTLADTDPNTGITKIYFSVRFSRAFASSEVYDAGISKAARVDWATAEGEAIEARVGISYVSVDQARANRVAEADARTFEAVRADAVAAWNRLLNRAEVEGATNDQRMIFYTALYHALLQPADYTEDGVFFSGADNVEGQVYPADGWHFYTDNWCLWDTAKTTHPLLTILEPEVVPDMVQSLVHSYEAGGWMHKCTWNAVGDSRVMIGNHAFCVAADAYVKGLRGFDADTALAAMKKGSMGDSVDVLDEGGCGWLEQGTPADYVDLGYISHECDSIQGASMTLEYAYNDWCVAQMAGAMGRTADEAFYRARSANWKNHFNPAHGFFQARHRDGSWVEPFSETAWDAGFCEADAWKYLWYVPHDPCGLIDTLGGRDAFLAKLDEFFDGGHFAPDNEPDFHVPYLYDVAGQPHRTVDRLREFVLPSFTTQPDGIPGNDDAGATAAWGAFAMLGLYPVAPGNGEYWLTAPAFPRTVLHLDPEREGAADFTIEAVGLSATSRYVQSATLDGETLATPRITHADLAKGGKLVLQMGPLPSDWGSAGACAQE